METIAKILIIVSYTAFIAGIIVLITHEIRSILKK